MREPDPDKESKMATAEVLPIDKPANWAGPDSYMISTEDLWKTYDMGSEQVHALRGINLRIQRNEYVAIMGPSGSGKSTLMNLIGCTGSTDNWSANSMTTNWRASAIKKSASFSRLSICWPVPLHCTTWSCR